MNIQGREVPVNFREELIDFEFNNAKYTETKLIASSPFREESRPSFAVNLENGLFIDSGGHGTYEKGNFIKLLGFLRNETYEEIEDYLISRYSPELGELDKLQLGLELKIETPIPPVFSISCLHEFGYRHPYLEGRGITENTQNIMRIGFCKRSNAVVIPWFNRNKELINWKFRKVSNKLFWYSKGGQRIGDNIYCMNLIYTPEYYKSDKPVAIVEGEIDAMYLWQNGIPAIALGGAYLSKKQHILLLQSPAESFILATDNDKAGYRIKESLIRRLLGEKLLYEIELPTNKKDVNELNPTELSEVFNKAKPILIRTDI